MEDEVRLVKRQLAIMAKARDVARQETADWKATCNRCTDKAESNTPVGPQDIKQTCIHTIACLADVGASQADLPIPTLAFGKSGMQP